MCRYRVNAMLDEKMFLVHHLDPEIRKMPVMGIMGTRILNFIVVYNSLAIEIAISILILKMSTSMPHKSWTRTVGLKDM